MYYNRPKNRRHAEDNFDLDRYKESFVTDKYDNYVKKNKKYVNVISVFIAIFTVVLGILLYSLVMYYVNLWKSEEIYGTADDNGAYTNDFISEKDNAISILDPETTGKDIAFNDVVIPNDTVADNLGNGETDQPKKISEAVRSLREKYGNDQIMGRIKIEGSSIKYPYAQTSDNEYYLKHSLDKSKNDSGAVYMDFQNNVEDFSQNTILYGHNMRNGTMFHNVRLYKDKYFYDTHKYIDISSPYEVSKWEIFAFYVAPIDFQYLRVDFDSEANYDEFLQEVKTRSLYETGVEVTSQDKILTLSTCTNDSEDTRYVVQAKLIKSSPIS